MNGVLTIAPKVTKCPWTTFSCNIEIDIILKHEVGSTNRQICWSLGMRIATRWPSPLCFHGPMNSLCIYFVNKGFAQFPFQYRVTRSNNMQFCCSIWFFAPRPKVTKCVWTTFSCDFQLDMAQKHEVRSMNRWIPWYVGMWLTLGGPLPYVFMAQWLMHWFWVKTWNWVTLLWESGAQTT